MDIKYKYRYKFNLDNLLYNLSLKSDGKSNSNESLIYAA